MHTQTKSGTDLPWWKTATGYQIYPRSFCDSNGDGVGDIAGIISKLDHLADLGIGFIWLSPVYASPMIDNGYDISDYRDIAPEFGTLADMDALIAEAHARGIRIVMDLVVNHCSSEHSWFKAALASEDAPEHDYFIWAKPGPQNGPPTPDLSYFGGSMWEWVPHLGKYYLHQFAKEQPDLNWQNPALRAEIYEMMNWWLDRGIGGFRMDVIDLIGKDIASGTFAEGPDLHRFLQEMHRETLAGRDVLTVGETWSVTPQTALFYCGADREELDMVFQFAHVLDGHHPSLGKWAPLPFDLPRFKASFFRWQEALAEDGWNALFLSNHDLPRQVSKYGDDGAWRVRSAKALALALHLMKGTPFVYQGEEIGMTNVAFTRMDQFRDVETFGQYDKALEDGLTEAAFIAGANANGRDNARTPMHWTDGDHAGFTTGTPWIDVNPNHSTINLQADRADPDGISAFYTRLIALRRTHPIVTLGRFEAVSADHAQVFAYTRTWEGQRLAVLVNLTGQPVVYDVPEALAVSGECMAATAQEITSLGGQITLAPFEGWAVLGPQG